MKVSFSARLFLLLYYSFRALNYYPQRTYTYTRWLDTGIVIKKKWGHYGRLSTYAAVLSIFLEAARFCVVLRSSRRSRSAPRKGLFFPKFRYLGRRRRYRSNTKSPRIAGHAMFFHHLSIFSLIPTPANIIRSMLFNLLLSVQAATRQLGTVLRRSTSRDRSRKTFGNDWKRYVRADHA